MRFLLLSILVLWGCVVDDLESDRQMIKMGYNKTEVQKTPVNPLDEKEQKIQSLESLVVDNQNQIQVLTKLVNDLKVQLDSKTVEENKPVLPVKQQVNVVRVDPTLIYGLPILPISKDIDYNMAVNMINSGDLANARASFHYVLKKYANASPEKSYVEGSVTRENVIQNVRFLIGYLYYKEDKFANAIEMFFLNFQENPKDTIGLQNLISLTNALVKLDKQEQACKVKKYIDANYSKRNDYPLILSKLPSIICNS